MATEIACAVEHCGGVRVRSYLIGQELNQGMSWGWGGVGGGEDGIQNNLG